MEEMKVLGLEVSPFSWRVELALKMKGIEYELLEENLQNKSEMLLKYNPIHKKIPVLLHSGKPVVESALILEYLDETWKDKPLLPTDPYERAQARFWADFIDNKLVPSLRNALLELGEESEKGMKESHELLNVFENSIDSIIGEKKFFGGDNLGFLDIITFTIIFAVKMLEEAVGKNLLTSSQFPKICDWVDRVWKCDFIAQNMPAKEKQVAYYRNFFQTKFANASK